MVLAERTLPLVPDVLALARSLRDRPDLVVLWDASGRSPSYLACEAIGIETALDPEPDLLLEARSLRESVPRWIGVLPYEAMRGIERAAYTAWPDPRGKPHLMDPIWLRYGAVVEVSDRVRVIGDVLEKVEALSRLVSRRAQRATRNSEGLALLPPEPPECHVKRIERALELIAAGDLYQVNLARRFELDVREDALELCGLLGARTRADHCALIRLSGVDIVACSPELFLQLSPDGRVMTRPIKGTRPRGNRPELDRALAAELDCDEKERAELTMVIDVERNDVGRIAEAGSVRVTEPPHVESFPTLHHRLATVEGRVRPGTTRTMLLESMLPSGSVTGAPKIRAMEVIAALEPHRRGLYTGAFGMLAHDGSLRLAMAIRTLTIDASGAAHYFSGGGIVADSDPVREVEETYWKALHLIEAASARR